jgi:phosphoglycolate phosphatase
MTGKPLVVFDLDGTLAETAGDLIATLNVVLAKDDVAPIALDQARVLLGAGARALIQRGYASAGRTIEKPVLEQRFHEFLAYYEAHICDHSHLFPGVHEALDRLERAGYLLAICTNKIEAPSIKLLQALGVAHRFAVICGQDTFPVHKPDAQALLLTIEKAGGVADRTVMVGDSITDIATAKAAGVPVIAVDFGYTDTPVRDLGPDRVISHFDALFEAVESLVPAAAL